MAGSLASRTLARPSFEAAFGATAFLRAMLAFESALAQAQAAEGLIPAASAAAIASVCQRIRIDEEALVAEGKRSATLAVPLVNRLREELKATAPDAAGHAHFGATSQDVLDTAMALCLRPCLEEADRALDAAVRSLAARAREHRATPMLGRTLPQPAVPITAGLKIARWAAALAADRERLADARSWHAQRNAWIDLLDRIGQAVLTLGKIARDVSLLSQPEVGEMLEAPPQPGRGASSAMPHKRNPVGCAHALAVVPEIAAALGTALDFLDTIAASLVVDAARMRANLEAYGEGAARAAGLEAAVDELLAALAPHLS